jgi:hypothetical protein
MLNDAEVDYAVPGIGLGSSWPLFTEGLALRVPQNAVQLNHDENMSGDLHRLSG